MRSKIINELMNQIKKYNDFDDIKLKEIKYGLETIYLTIIKTIIFIILAMFINTVKELLLFLLFYGIIRLTGFGVHAIKSIHCWIASIIIFILTPLLIKYSDFPNIIIYMFILISNIFIILYAPADTPKRPLKNKKKRIRYKIITLIISTIYSSIILMTNIIVLKNSLLYSLILESFLVTPFIYKLFGVSYKNYEIRKEMK